MHQTFVEKNQQSFDKHLNIDLIAAEKETKTTVNKKLYEAKKKELKMTKLFWHLDTDFHYRGQIQLRLKTFHNTTTVC